MMGGFQLKVCGLTSPADAAAAVQVGAEYLGFNFYPKSPRAVTLGAFRAMADRLPLVPKVAICVEPSALQLAALEGSGCQYFQIHFRPETPLAQIAAWSAHVRPERLWLAPKLPPGTELAPAWLPLARTFLLDTYDPEKFGGTGKTGDWTKFARIQQANPRHTWILSGGLNAGNIGEAVRQSGARFIDVNSGVESSPGIKDAGKLEAFVTALRRRPPAAAAGA
jgi:phosphoribosylanthranilate isomerase